MNNVEVLSAIREWEQIIFQHEPAFLHDFCNDAWILVEVSWDSENMRFVYVINSGQHISDSIKIEKWVEFIESKKEK